MAATRVPFLVNVIASPDVAGIVQDRGGRLCIWTDALRCCAPVAYLRTGHEPPARPHRFERIPVRGFELFLDTGRLTLPDELHLDVHGWRRNRVEAYWNGCVYVDRASSRT